jgi:hypothetical protein
LGSATAPSSVSSFTALHIVGSVDQGGGIGVWIGSLPEKWNAPPRLSLYSFWPAVSEISLPKVIGSLCTSSLSHSSTLIHPSTFSPPQSTPAVPEVAQTKTKLPLIPPISPLDSGSNSLTSDFSPEPPKLSSHSLFSSLSHLPFSAHSKKSFSSTDANQMLFGPNSSAVVSEHDLPYLSDRLEDRVEDRLDEDLRFCDADIQVCLLFLCEIKFKFYVGW